MFLKFNLDLVIQLIFGMKIAFEIIMIILYFDKLRINDFRIFSDILKWNRYIEHANDECKSQ